MNIQALPNAIFSYPVQPSGGGSQPRFYEFDDGIVRLVKWHPGHGLKMCFNELVCSRLGQLAGAPVLRGQPVYVDKDVMAPDDARFAKPGVHYGVARMEGQDFHPDTDIPLLSNQSQIAQACAFLAWLNVGDQDGHNQYTQRIVAPGAPDPTFLLRLIDMGFAFGGPNWSAAILPAVDTYAYKAPGYLVASVSPAAATEATARLALIEEADILASFRDVPEEWGVPQEDAEAASRWTVSVRSKILDVLRTAHPNLRTA